ncbi:DUF1656 domain-containing protein [Methylobacterium oryzae CBMB20]
MIGVVGLRAVDVLGLFVEPAVICLLAALVITWGLRWILDRIGINHPRLEPRPCSTSAS